MTNTVHVESLIAVCIVNQLPTEALRGEALAMLREMLERERAKASARELRN